MPVPLFVRDRNRDLIYKPVQEVKMARPEEQPPWKLEFRSSKKFVIWVVSIGVFTVCLCSLTGYMSGAEILFRMFLFMAW